MTDTVQPDQTIESHRWAEWHIRAVCPCGWHTPAPHGSLFHVQVNCCPRCGEYKPHDDWRGKWILRTMRWISEASLWRPWTWGSGRWEVRE